MMHPTMSNLVLHGMKYHASAGRRLGRILRRPSLNANASPLVFPAAKQQLRLGLSATDMSMGSEITSHHGFFHFDGIERGLSPLAEFGGSCYGSYNRDQYPDSHTLSSMSRHAVYSLHVRFLSSEEPY